MCGIIGVTCLPSSRNQKVAEIITNGLRSLEYRGYDSVGIAMIDASERRIIIKKSDGMLEQVAKRYDFPNTPGFTGIGHTRWATHGAPTQINAHPQVDCKQEIAVVHNGIVKNFLELKRELEAKGHIFKSETDTEVIAHMVEELSKNSDTFTAFKKTVSMLEGSYALALVSVKEPDKIFFARRESPLIIGISEGINLIASDIPAMLDHTNTFIPLSDGEVGWISPSHVHLESLSGEVVDLKKRIIYVDWKSDMVRKGGYPHFMIKEIHEQPQVLKNTYEGLMSDDILDRAADLLMRGEKLFVTAAGTSYHASLLLKLFFEKLTGKIVYPFIASEFRAVEHLADRGDIIMVVSQSGETIDTMKAMRAFRARGATAVAITNVMGSTIGREADFTIPMRAGPEIGVAATKTFLTQALVASLLSIKFSSKMGKMGKDEERRALAILGEAGRIAGESIAMTEGAAKGMAERIHTTKSLYFLGRGLGVPLAYEAALKLKEISYIHAEAYPAGESKHGPIALVERDFPVFFIVSSDSSDEIASNVAEMNARGALTVALAPEKFKEKLGAKVLFRVPEVDPMLEPYALTPPFQLLAYYTAVRRGYNPDRPRNLAKTVTVE